MITYVNRTSLHAARTHATNGKGYVDIELGEEGNKTLSLLY